MKCDYCAAPKSTHLLESSRTCDTCLVLIMIEDWEGLVWRAYEALLFVHPDIVVEKERTREALRMRLREMIYRNLNRLARAA